MNVDFYFQNDMRYVMQLYCIFAFKDSETLQYCYIPCVCQMDFRVHFRKHYRGYILPLSRIFNPLRVHSSL